MQINTSCLPTLLDWFTEVVFLNPQAAFRYVQMEEGFMIKQQAWRMICLKPLLINWDLHVSQWTLQSATLLLSNLKWKFSFHSKTVWVLFSVLLCVSYVSSASLFVFSFFPFLSVSHTLMASVTSVCGPTVSQTGWASWLNRYSDACVLVTS